MKQIKPMAKAAFAIFLFALSLSVIGFFVDSDPREPSIATNLFEISMMTLILFAFISVLFGSAIGLTKLLKRG
ncbi:MAG: hypothetical protein AAGG68_27595 [Bacteroidota bacterium]